MAMSPMLLAMNAAAINIRKVSVAMPNIGAEFCAGGIRPSITANLFVQYDALGSAAA